MKKKINLLYLAIIPLCYVLFQMNASLSQSSAFFYGFAENKETELSHDRPVSIDKIVVIPGQSVTKGQLLLKVKQSSFDYKIEAANFDLQQLEVQTQQRKQELRDRIDQLKIRRSTKVAEIDADIRSLESVIAYNESLLEDLQSFKNEKVGQKNSPNHIKLEAAFRYSATKNSWRNRLLKRRTKSIGYSRAIRRPNWKHSL